MFLDLAFGGIFALIINPIFEWATDGVVVFSGNAIINFRLRDDFPIMQFLAMILNFIFPIITCLIVGIIHKRKVTATKLQRNIP